MRSSPVLFRLPHRVATGSWHMESDRALLDWVSCAPARLVVRTYDWDRPTLSLGRKSPYPEGWDEGVLAREGVRVVRRPTGGDAVLHVDEVTFAVAASIPGPSGLTPRGFASATAEAVSAALTACGVTGSRVEHAPFARAERREGTICFARSAPGEVLASGFKVAGLASRFARTGALCHGSIPLTSRSRSIARFRRERDPEVEALERHARSVGELLGGPQAAGLLRELRERLALEVSSRFDAPILDVSLDAVGIEEERAEVGGFQGGGA